MTDTDRSTGTMNKRELVARVGELEDELARLRAAGPDLPPEGHIVVTLPAYATGRSAPGYTQIRWTKRQAIGVRAVFDGVNGIKCLENGRVVNSKSGAIRWVFEQVANALPGV